MPYFRRFCASGVRLRQGEKTPAPLYIVYVRSPEVALVRSPSVAPSPWKYGRVPATVFGDLRLKHSDIRVYAAMAAPTGQGSTSSVGSRMIAKATGVGVARVRQGIKRLVECGHIKLAERKRGERPIYIFLSTVFAQKQGKVDESIVLPDGGKKIVSVRRKSA
jgi:hypothetical protein